MRTPFRGHFRTGIAAVRTARWRSLSTVFGVVVGVASVVTVVSIGQGIKNQVAGQIDTLGKDLITIRPGELTKRSDSFLTNQVFSSLQVSGSLSPSDLEAIKNTKDVRLTAPLHIVSGSVTGDTKQVHDGLVVGTTDAFDDVMEQTVAYGSFFEADDESRNRAILGAQAATELFDEDVPLGRSFDLRGERFVVTGIFDEFENAPLSLDTNFNNTIFIPRDTALNLTQNEAPMYEVLVRAVDLESTKRVASDIKHTLIAAHGGAQDVTVLTQEDSLAATGRIIDLITLLTAGVAAIALLVGGIGIMNVMLVSVTERMHEIGVRKAVGATNRQILNQFLIEASVLTFIGGIIGIIIAAIINGILHLVTDLQPALSWQAALIAAGVSILVGVLFGSIPALKAARKDPIEALRRQ